MLRVQFFLLFLLISCQTKPPLLKKGPRSPSYWPTKTWKESTPEKQGMDSKKLTAMLQLLKKENYKIDNISIIRNGFLVTDYYKYPYKKEKKHIIHSVTKSILSALVGIAIDKGYIKSVNAKVIDFFPQKLSSKNKSRLKDLTLEHLLMMSSGLKTEDNWRYKWKGLIKMRGQEDWVQYLLDLPLESPPGKKFNYSNGVSYLISALLFKATRKKPQDFAQKYLFNPLGISKSNIKWKLDPRGTHIGWGGMHMRPRDMAKFGLLYLNKGKWEDKQIISKKWIEASTKTHLESDLYQNYGYQWWNGPAMYRLDKLWRNRWNFTFSKKEPSENYYMAVGFMGQFIYIIPDRNMVVVFTSHLPIEKGKNFIPKALLDEYILPSVISNSSLKENKGIHQKFNSLISHAKRERPFIWLSQNEGLTRKNVFKRADSPSFSLDFPVGSTQSKLMTDQEIMALTTPMGARISINLDSISKGVPLEKNGGIIKENFKKAGDNVRLVKNEVIHLKDQTKVLKSTIEWNFLTLFPVRTIALSIYKKGKLITITYSYDSLEKSSKSYFERDFKIILDGLIF
tara:strand:+ start:7161 stop:8864 length:1704 start_codon:yes stop_codon:yes gene_type:complete